MFFIKQTTARPLSSRKAEKVDNTDHTKALAASLTPNTTSQATTNPPNDHRRPQRVKPFKSHETTLDVDYLAAYTDALLESKGLEGPIVLVSKRD